MPVMKEAIDSMSAAERMRTMGLEELMTYKYAITGDGVIRK